MKNNNNLKMKSVFMFSVLIVILMISSVMTIAKTKKVYNGDQYITSIRLNHGDGKQIVNGDTMYINEKYSLEYNWEIPDNTFKQGESLDFSIPKEFKIVDKMNIILKDGSQEVARADVEGNDTDGYYIHMTFTTDYVETHSLVSGKFDFNYILNEKYIKQGSDNTILLPDQEITVHVPEYDGPSEGGGGGVDAGDVNANKKMGQEPDITTAEHPVVFKWQIDLGKNQLLGKANSFEEIKHIYVEDKPKEQKLIPFSELDDYWKDAFAFDGAFFTNAEWVHDGLPMGEMTLNKSDQGDYYDSFKVDILPRIEHYIEKAEPNDGNPADFKQYKIEYYTEPLHEPAEDTQFDNDATVTIEYENGEKDSWNLSHSIMYNVAEGSITGKTGGVTFEKIDADNNKSLTGAEFDLYQQLNGKDDKKIQSGIKTDAKGKVEVDNLTVGNYYFVETKAPEGYELSKEKLAFTLERQDMSSDNQNIKIKDIGQFKNNQTKNVDVSVAKNWKDNENQDGIRPKSIQVQLYADGKESGKPVELNEGNSWKYTWKNLSESSNGQSIKYTVKEVSDVPGYTSSINDSNISDVIITNTHNPETTEIKGEKYWDDANNQDGKRPTSIKVNLLADGKVKDTKTVTEKDNWKYEFTNLPKYNQGELIHYTVTENTVEDYSTTVNGTDLTNHYTPGKTSVTITKHWEDNNNQDGIRPKSIQVQLYADGKESGKPVELNEGNAWTYTWQELAEKANGQTINYTVKEVSNVPGYTVTATDSNLGNIIITNTHDPETTEIKGEKHWDDANNQDGKRPTSVEVNLLADGEVKDTKTVTEKDNWQYEFTNLPKYHQGKVIKYTVTENTVENYSTTVNGTDLTNHYTPGKTSVTVTKDWKDNNNQDGIRPKSIQVQLYADGKESGKPVELNEGNAWTYTWQELAEKANGTTIKYTVKEINEVLGYITNVLDDNIGNIIIINTHNPEKTEIKGEKHWDDANNQDGKRPTSIEVNLLADGEVIDSKTVTEKDNWQYEFTNLPKYHQGELIKYTVTENAVTDYSTTVSGADLTNHYTPGKTSVTVTKRWEDNQNQDGLRPEAIQVQLYADGKESGKPVELNDSNKWQYTWQELDEKANGKTIHYTVKEIEKVPGYSMSVSDNDKGNIIITNTHTPEITQVKGEKHWDDANNQDGKRPTSIELNLLANGKVIETKTVTEKDNWQYDFTNLPKYESGKEINYTVTENTVAGYSTSIDGTDITNHYTPGKTSVTVTKRWEDNQNKHNKRPTNIQVQLYADGKRSGKAVELNEDNHWTHTWDKLAEKANGKTINYTVEEITNVPGYTTNVNDTNIGNIIITNTLNDESRDNVPNTGGNNNTSNGQSNNNSNSQNKLPSTGEKSGVMLFISGLVVLMISAIVVWYVKQHSVTE